MEIEVYKYRSVRHCLRDAYTAISENLKSVFRKTWWVVSLGAIALSFTTYFFLPNMALHVWGLENQIASFVVQSLVYLATIVFGFWVLCAFWHVINGRRWRENLPRVIVTQLLSAAIACLFKIALDLLAKWLLSVPASPAEQQMGESTGITWLFAVIGLGIVAVVTCMPLCYTFIRFMMGKHWLPFVGYGRGFRYWGTIFVAMLLIYLLAGIALAAVSLPVVILVSAQLYSQLGALGGDPLNIPGYFTPLLIVTLTLFYFVAGYISLWAQLASTFLYGSIETQQAEKNKHDREENQTAIY